MTTIEDLLSPGSVVIDLNARSKKQLFMALAEIASDRIGKPAGDIVAVVSQRERLGSTGFGEGIAIPHGKIDGLSRAVGVFARLADPLDYDAIDQLPVSIVMLLLSPAEAGMEHLKALAGVSRVMRDTGLVNKVRGAGSADAVYALLTSASARDAAA
jgi:PTS system nitrogen regulatory IIA component